MMDNATNLARLTLVVPTYERQDFALRLINYWSNKGPKLIVLDGSKNPIDSEILSQLSKHVHYLHRPVGVYRRLLESLDLIQTEFVALAGDDEFYVPSAVDACIKELDENQEMVACCGRALAFSVCDQIICGGPQYPRLENYLIGSDEPGSRVSDHMREYVPSLVYAICRTKLWKASWESILEREFPIFAIGELQFEMCMSYAGKSRVIPELMWLRSENETEPVRGNAPSLDPKKRFPDWWRNPKNKDEHEEFLVIMSSAFEKLLPDSKGDRRSAVIGGIDSYIDFYFGRRGKRKNKAKVILKSLLVPVLPQRVKQYLKFLLRWVRPSSTKLSVDLIPAAKVLRDSGVYIDFDAIEEIRDIVAAFHESRKLSKS